jgi:mitochondrial fusion and transport protein UGO1
MSGSREGPNPLRPYYIPPSIGPPPDVTGAASSASHTFSNKNGTAPTYASSARDIFSDIDYSDYVPEGSLSTVDMIKELLDQALYKYTSVLLAQPFEVAKTVLQVRSQAGGDGSIPVAADADDMREGASGYRESSHGDVSDCYTDFLILC